MTKLFILRMTFPFIKFIYVRVNKICLLEALNSVQCFQCVEKLCYLAFELLKKKKERKDRTDFPVGLALSWKFIVNFWSSLLISAPKSNRDVFKNSFCSNKTRVYDSLSDFVLSTNLFVQENRFLRIAHTAGSLCPCFYSCCCSDDTTLAHKTCIRDKWRKTW